MEQLGNLLIVFKVLMQSVSFMLFDSALTVSQGYQHQTIPHQGSGVKINNKTHVHTHTHANIHLVGII